MAKAAERLALSQPAISKAVSDMEHILGTSLLDRSARGVALTESGRLIVERTRVIFDEISQGVSDIECLSDPTRGIVKIGTTEPVASVVSEIISRLASKYPGIGTGLSRSESMKAKTNGHTIAATAWTAASRARRGELVVGAPVGFVKAGDRLEKDPDRRTQEAITLVFDNRVRVLASSVEYTDVSRWCCHGRSRHRGGIVNT